MNVVVISLGSNRGDREEQLRTAREAIKEVFQFEKASKIYETPPWGFEDPQPFLNQVVVVSTTKPPRESLDELLKIERSMGRMRGDAKSYTPRTIDLDILFYDDVIILEDHLIIPHPRIADRKFVLQPLTDLMPEFKHPETGITIEEMLMLTNDHSTLTEYPCDTDT